MSESTVPSCAADCDRIDLVWAAKSEGDTRADGSTAPTAVLAPAGDEGDDGEALPVGAASTRAVPRSGGFDGVD